MRKRFKTPELQRLYEHLMESPPDRRWQSSLHEAYFAGYDGNTRKPIVWMSFAHAAFRAGQDKRAEEDKENEKRELA